MNEETLVRIMVYEIRDKTPEFVNFIPTTENIKSILLYLKTRRYHTLMCVFGKPFLLEILKMFEDVENYEECEKIMKQINLK